MKKITFFIFAFSLLLMSCNSNEKESNDNVSPRVISTFPVNGSVDVDPSITQITVTFNEEMKDNSWSWTGGGDTFPTIVGSIYYTEYKTKCFLPVKLEPRKEYVIGINSKSHKNFKDKSGNPVNPFILSFKTK